MALLFSFSLATDKFVIGRVVTAIDYPSMQFSIRLAAATVVALLAKSRCSHASKGMPSKSIRTALTTRLNVFGFVKPARAQRRQSAASGERGAGNGAAALVPASSLKRRGAWSSELHPAHLLFAHPRVGSRQFHGHI